MRQRWYGYVVVYIVKQVDTYVKQCILLIFYLTDKMHPFFSAAVFSYEIMNML